MDRPSPYCRLLPFVQAVISALVPLVDLVLAPAFPAAPHPGGLPIEDQRTFPRLKLAVRKHLLELTAAFLVLVGAEMAELRRPMQRPVAPPPERLGPARVGRASPTDVVVTQVP